MKLSVFAVLLAAKPFDEACKYLANAGVQAVEIGCGGFPGKAHCDPKEFLAHPEKIDEMLATLKKYNLEIAALSTHGNCVHPNPEVARQFEEDYENTILLADLAPTWGFTAAFWVRPREIIYFVAACLGAFLSLSVLIINVML